MERKAEWKEKALHGQHLRQTENIASKDSWIWLTNGNLKKETEGLLIAAQDQALRTNVIKANIDKSRDDPKCRMCKEGDESVTHIISQCKKLAQTEYKIRHDNVAKAVHWELCKKNGLDHVDKWYDHEPESVMENEKCKILWDFTIQTDRMIGARRPDITIVNKETRECQLIDIACPGDNKVAEKEDEKIDKYRDLAREVSKLWNVKVAIIPVVIGALGTVPTMLESRIKEIGISIKTAQIQKTVLLGTARILRKVLEI